MAFYDFARIVAGGLVNILYRIKVEGVENIPDKGPVILVPNHINNMDPIVVALPVKRKVHFMAKEELFSIPVLNTIIKHLGAFPVKRGKFALGAYKASLEILEKGKVLGIFPEGTRSKTGKLQPAYSGVASLALKTGAAIVPVAIVGKYRFGEKIKVKYGEPFRLDSDAVQSGKHSSEELGELMNNVMNKIKALLEEG